MVLMIWIWLLLLLTQRVISGSQCNNSQYYDIDSQICKACSSCKSDEFFMRLCSEFGNSLCSRWIWRVGDYAHKSLDKSGSPVKPSTTGDLNSAQNPTSDLDHTWNVTGHVFLGMLCVTSVVLIGVIVFAIYMYRKRKLDYQYSGAWSVMDKKGIVLVNNDYHCI